MSQNNQRQQKTTLPSTEDLSETIEESLINHMNAIIILKNRLINQRTSAEELISMVT